MRNPCNLLSKKSVLNWGTPCSYYIFTLDLSSDSSPIQFFKRQPEHKHWSHPGQWSVSEELQHSVNKKIVFVWFRPHSKCSCWYFLLIVTVSNSNGPRDTILGKQWGSILYSNLKELKFNKCCSMSFLNKGFLAWKRVIFWYRKTVQSHNILWGVNNL